jgi:hypothetical protein
MAIEVCDANMSYVEDSSRRGLRGVSSRLHLVPLEF